MKRVLLIIGLLLFAAVFVQAQEATEEAMMDADIRIGLWDECETPQDLPAEILFGAPLGLTGPISIYGVPEQQGVDIAVQEINESGYLGATQIVMQYEDTEGAADQAITAMTKLIEEDGAVAIFGPSLSTEAFAADPIAQEAGIPVMGVTTSASGIPEIGDFVFRGNLPEVILIPFMIEQVDALFGLDQVGVLYGDDDDFTLSGYDVFIDALEANEITILDEATFARGDVDFNPQLTRLLSLEPDAIVVSALGVEGIQIINQARELGFEGLILGGNGFSTPNVLEETGENGTNLIVGASWNVNGGNALSQQFVASFEEAYGRQPDQFAVQAYNAIWLFATAIRCEGSVEGEAIRDGLLAIQDFESPLGLFSFSEVGDAIHEPVVQVVRDGAFTLLTEELAAEMTGE